MAEDRTKVLIVDDHRVVIEGIKAALADHPDFEVCGTATDGLEAIDLARSLGPDIVIMDISMPKMSGMKASQEVKRISGKIRIVIFSMHGEPEYILSLFQNGVSAYVLKESPLSELISALQTVRKGERYFAGSVQDVLVKHLGIENT